VAKRAGRHLRVIPVPPVPAGLRLGLFGPTGAGALTAPVLVSYNVAHSLEVGIMSANAVVRARIDKHIKEEASVVLETMGLTTSDAIRLMLTRVAREKALPFEPLVPNKKTIEAMKQARRGKLDVVTLDEIQAVLDADD
jgi:DNA-damage-inducible protein J